MPKEIPIYNIPESERKGAPFQILQLDNYKGYASNIPHRHNYFELFLFEKGSGVHEIDFREIQIKPFSVHFVCPGQVHYLRRSPDSTGTVIIFTKEFYFLPHQMNQGVSEFPFLSGFGNATIEPGDSVFESLVEIVQLMKKELNAEASDSEQILRNYLSIILLQLKRVYSDSEGIISDSRSRNYVVFDNFRKLLEAHYISIRLVKQYAVMLNVSPENLNALSKQVTGKTASALIDERVILEAKRLLLFSENSVKEVAYFLEFNDPSYFNKYFKKITGLTPENYRKSRLTPDA
ncbi:MAG: helix-turn-helix domain-containing protein [Bacteroidetes bacterium]|nr:helix-turn-helix domain-containing protein [Bacteroidota bacterium]